ncbi:MAG: hypothetical protein ABEJ75_04515 [Candidatus Nanohaloarchaea archaeon]
MDAPDEFSGQLDGLDAGLVADIIEEVFDGSELELGVLSQQAFEDVFPNYVRFGWSKVPGETNYICPHGNRAEAKEGSGSRECGCPSPGAVHPESYRRTLTRTKSYSDLQQKVGELRDNGVSREEGEQMFLPGS